MKKRRVTLRLPEKLYEKAMKEAENKDVSVNDIFKMKLIKDFWGEDDL